jgi:hypothetical protein
MARYLPRDYEPIPDALLYSDADLLDITRRIARNQNWIWANHGNVLAAWGHEPSGVQATAVTGVGTFDVAYFACPNRTATGSDSVRVCGYWDKSGGSSSDVGTLRLYQLLPGENTPTADSPYDETTNTTGGTDLFFDFNARIRSGADPLRFCLRLIGSGTATFTLLSVTVTWVRNPSAVLGETVAPWAAISQGYCTADRPMSAALLRAIANRTLRLMAENPRPIYSHSFVWPRISTAAAGTETRVGLWSLKHDGLTTPLLRMWLRTMVTGQSAQVTFRAKLNGTTVATLIVGPTGLTVADAEGVYIRHDAYDIGGFVSMPTGDVKIEVTAQCITGATAPPTYCTNVGGVLLGFSAWQSTRTAANLGLPGADTVPAAYQPLDESACAPGRSVVAQDDRLGRRAGPYYLVKNLMWLAANRTQHVLCADWMHRTEVAGWLATSDAGDGVLRNGSVWGTGGGGSDPYERAPNARDVIPWADRPAPTNSNKFSLGGHHYIGDVLGRFYCQPMNGGQIAAILRPDVVYPPNAPGTKDTIDLEFRFGSTRDARAPMSRQGLAGGFRSVARGAARPSAGTILSLRANANIPQTGAVPSKYLLNLVAGAQAVLQAAYIFEAPLTQTELDALA